MTTVHDDVTAIAAEFARGAATRDLDAMGRLFAPGATWWHALDDTTRSVEESLGYFGAVLGVTTELSYVDVRVTSTATGYVDQHRVHAVLRDGRQVRIPAVLVATVEAGLITHLDEYIEGTAAAPIAAALTPTPEGA